MVIHDLYGIGIRTPWPVAGAATRRSGSWDVDLVEGDAASFAQGRACIPPDQAESWAQGAALPDGSRYRRWAGLFEFLVSPDGRCIRARALPGADHEALASYLLVDALAYSLVRLGQEPLHATALAIGGEVVGFIGQSGDGKSTLAALCLRAGHRLLTDDMLALTEEDDGFRAHPGPPRIKLYRDIADLIFDRAWHGVPMNPNTAKCIIALDPRQAERHGGRLAALYLIGEPRDAAPAPLRPDIRRLHPSEALPEILAATAGHWLDERERLRQQFDFVTRLVRRVPVKRLRYARDVSTMTDVRDAVLEDLARPRE